MGCEADKHILDNGLALLGEPIANVRSAAFDFMLPAGEAIMPNGRCGVSNVIADWIFRGAGGRDSRQLGDELDGLGLHRGSSVDSSHLTIGAVLESGNLGEAMELYADVILRPRLEDVQFEPARQLAIEAVSALDDDPRQKVMLRLQEEFYGLPLGRSTVGKAEELEALGAEETRQLVQEKFRLSESIFSVAGRYDFSAVVRQMSDLFAARQGKVAEQSSVGCKGKPYTHIPNEGAQIHIGIMTKTVKAEDEDYYNARAAVGVLSGGMSARLFTEVREKRGLCYAIGARYHSLKEAAGIACYAGTSPDKAEQTLDVVLGEFRRLAEGISGEELDRAKIGLKSALILQSESSSSRAGAIGGDYYILGRVRSLDEIRRNIEQVSVDSVLGFLKRNRFEDFTIVSIGPKELKVRG